MQQANTISDCTLIKVQLHATTNFQLLFCSRSQHIPYTRSDLCAAKHHPCRMEMSQTHHLLWVYKTPYCRRRVCLCAVLPIPSAVSQPLESDLPCTQGAAPYDTPIISVLEETVFIIHCTSLLSTFILQSGPETVEVRSYFCTASCTMIS